MHKSIKLAICLLLLILFPATAFAGEVLDTYEPTTLSKTGAYYMAELHTDTILFSKNADKQMYPASLTKIMTAIVALEHCPDLNQMVTYIVMVTL